jgi:hypothetical protein
MLRSLNAFGAGLPNLSPLSEGSLRFHIDCNYSGIRAVSFQPFLWLESLEKGSSRSFPNTQQTNSGNGAGCCTIFRSVS